MTLSEITFTFSELQVEKCVVLNKNSYGGWWKRNVISLMEDIDGTNTVYSLYMYINIGRR